MTVASGSSDPALFQAQREMLWHSWRGSPALLAQVARVSLKSVGADGTAERSCLIDIEVGDDHEVFSSASDFVTTVTREALRGFRSIRIRAENGDLGVEVDLLWCRPWWKPGIGSDADVRLHVHGASEEAAESAFNAVRGAVKRGRTELEYPQAITGLVFTGLAMAAGAGAGSISYLLGLPSNTAWLVGFIVALAGFPIGVLWGTWAFPSLEVAPVGETHLVRILKIAIPLVAGLVATGIAKAIYGS